MPPLIQDMSITSFRRPTGATFCRNPQRPRLNCVLVCQRIRKNTCLDLRAEGIRSYTYGIVRGWRSIMEARLAAGERALPALLLGLADSTPRCCLRQTRRSRGENDARRT